MPDFYESLAALYQRLAQQQQMQQQAPPASDPSAMLGPMDQLGGGGDPIYGGLFGAIQQAQQLGVPINMAGGGGGSFTPTGSAGSAGTYGGQADINDLLTRHGITGVPAGVRHLLQGARQTGVGVPALSDAIFGSGYRSFQEQQALYQQHLAGTHPAPVAPPGHSMHEAGRAWDINSNWLSEHPEYRTWLLRHGFEFPVAGEPWHAEWQGKFGSLNPPQRAPAPAPVHRAPRRSSSSTSYQAARMG